MNRPTAMPSLKDRKKITAAALVKEIPMEVGWINSATLTPDGRLVVGRHGEIEVVDLATGESKSTKVPATNGETLSELRFTPDGKRLVATMWNGSVAVLSWPKLTKLKVHEVAENQRLHALAVLPDGKSAWVGGHDETRTRIDLESGKVLAKQRGEDMWLSTAALSPDGKRLVTSDAAAKVRISDGKTGKQIKVLSLGCAKHAVVTAEEALVASVHMATIKLATGKVTTQFEGEHALGASAAVFLDEGHVASVGEHDPLLVIWDRKSGKPLMTLKPRIKGTSEALFVVGEHLVTVPRGQGPIAIWRTAALLDFARKARSGGRGL